MLLKKTIGILIIICNIGGIGFILFQIAMQVKEKYFPDAEPETDETAPARKPEVDIAGDDIVPDEDDLLKDMDLSDLDNLDFDDFE